MRIKKYYISGKIVIISSLLIIFIFPSLSVCQVLNGSFEIDDQPSLEYWLIGCQDAESFQDAPAGGGTWCIRSLAGNLQGCFPRTIEQIIPDLNNGDIVELRVWARQAANKSSLTSVYLKVFDSDKTRILSVDTTTANQWTQLIVTDTLFLGKDDTVVIVLDAGTTSGPDILDHNSYFDLVEIEKIGEVITSENSFGKLHPLKFRLYQNFPNPFNPKTIINYELPTTNYVDLSVYSLLGQRVATMVAERKPAGYHQVTWDASGFANGIYYYSLQAGEYHVVKKMVLVK